MNEETEKSGVQPVHADRIEKSIFGPYGQIHNWSTQPENLSRRRMTAWLIGVAAVIAGVLVITLVVVNKRSPSQEAVKVGFSGQEAVTTRPTPSGPELVADAKIFDTDGLPMVVPGDYRPQPKFLTMEGAGAKPELADDLYAAGGVRILPAVLGITLTGNRDQEIRITDITPVIAKRTDPLTGTLFLLIGQGSPDNIGMTVDFDAVKPIARNTDGQPYFNKRTITLQRDEHELVDMSLLVNKFYVEFDLKFDYIIGTQTKSLTLDNRGKHFRLTALRPGSDLMSHDLSARKASYDRGYAMRGDFSLCPIDPKVSSYCPPGG